MLAKVCGSQQAFHNQRFRLGRLIRQKRLDFFGSGRQSDQVKRHPPEPGPPVRGLSRLQVGLFDSLEHEGIQGTLDPRWIFHFGRR